MDKVFAALLLSCCLAIPSMTQAAPQAPVEKPQVQRELPQRDEHGRFVAKDKAQPAKDARAERALPQRDEKGRFVSSKNSQPPMVLTAKKGSDVFHRPGCRFYDPKAEMKFGSVKEAEKAGLRPCKACNK